MAELPRGIAPDLLISQVRSTAPYLFEDAGKATAAAFPPVQILRETNPKAPLTHFEYFRLCLSAHFASVATPVPTDVDNQIRQKLWPAHLPLADALAMAELVSESHDWKFLLVTRRFGCGAGDYAQEPVSGHLGEWFTVAAGAYCALGRYSDERAKTLRSRIFEQIQAEVNRHSEIFGSLWRAEDGLGALRASAALAHNFGDLDRVMDQWDLRVDDPLRLECYKLGARPLDANRKLRHKGRLWVAGELYKATIAHGSSLALENHRHFPLRKPRCLRRSPEFMIQTGPFLDAWGVTVAQGLATSGKASAETREVLEALFQGWPRLSLSVGYGRAIRGMLSVHPELKAKDFAESTHAMRSILELPQDRFEKAWHEGALRELDEIPSRMDA